MAGAMYNLPNVIDSAGSKSGNAHVIRSNHNVSGLLERIKLGLLLP